MKKTFKKKSAMHVEVISGYDRPRGGSRYADKQPKRKKGIPKRQAAGRRRRRDSRLLIWLLVILMTAAVCLAGAWIFSSWKEKQAGKTQELLDQIQVDLTKLDSPCAILLDDETGTVLASKNGDDRIYPASMVKIMTVLTAIESIDDLDAKIQMSYDIYDALYEQDASRAGFEPGEQVTARELLYGALLPSGAECCAQLALESAGSQEAFVEKMNANAEKLGLTGTHFTNVTGLHNDDQYSTPHEIGKILQSAIKNKTFYEVFTTHFYTAPATEQHPDGFTFWSTMFKNMTDEVVNGGEIIGGKTGYTDEAGHCLASAAKIDDRIYILVTAGWAQGTDSATYHISDAFLAYNQIAPPESAQ